ncbi:hypothetical protein [Chromatium okenii]|jgi:hypothetical protein|uniref:hypothetical protein n=1 Tax=Chromatium okenii TaxID=61644 RepID=UPI0026EDA8E6|nr:hypothetical protein [Chromatium okenii]MBV5308375.1 hypothetical protein [Chromatium okenii]
MLTNRNLKQVGIERQCPEAWIEADNIHLSSERNLEPISMRKAFDVRLADFPLYHCGI